MSSEVRLPGEFADSMQQILNTAYGDFVASLSQTGPVSIRLNQAKKNDKLASLANVPWCSTGRYLPERPVFTTDPTFHAGAYYVQEASSMFLEQAIMQSVDLNKSLTVLDLCAAPGGKSTHLLNLINRESLLVSNEVIRSRAGILAENIQKCGNNNVIVTNNDPGDFQRLKGFFDVIVIDAPCSGEGLFRKDPDAMNEWSPENVNLCSKRQRRILHDVWPALKKDGILIYSTCTYNTIENEDNIAWAKDQLGVEFISLNTDTAWGIEEIMNQNISGYHFYPHKVKGEGFFISVMRKTADQESAPIKIKNRILQLPSAKITEQINNWVSNAETKHFFLWRDNILMVPASLASKVEFVVQHLHIISTGTMIGELKHNKLIPDHALALSIDLNKNFFNLIPVTLDEALQYLRKETLPTNNEKKGFALITYEDLPIGWVNVLDNRMNNLYPANWRIRMTV